MKTNYKDFQHRPRKKSHLIFGVGLNDAEYQVRYVEGGVRYACPYYARWTSMLERAYGSKKAKCYLGVTVDKKWHKFSNFKHWMEGQKWEGLQLDKDLIKPGNKVYSPGLCVFIPHSLNTAITYGGKTSKSLGGVSEVRVRGKTFYEVQCCLVNGSRYSKRFKDIGCAYKAYAANKIKTLKYYRRSYNKDNAVYKGISAHCEHIAHLLIKTL